MAVPRTANEFIEHQLDDRAKSLEGQYDADLLSINGGIIFGLDDVIRATIDHIGERREGKRRPKMIVMLTTGGGYIEVAQRIVETMRHHYAVADFIVPNLAFSAGTVLTLSGDAIHMDYYSRLGPIDPQVDTANGTRVPALGYLSQYQKLLDKAAAGTISVAELRLMIDGFDQAELYKYEQARNLTITLLKRWLAKYKFKNWTKTQTRGHKVTNAMRTKRAATIAKALNRTEKWHSHGYGISMDELTNDLKLLINDFGRSTDENRRIKDYAELLDDYMAKRGDHGVVHAVGRYTPFN